MLDLTEASFFQDGLKQTYVNLLSDESLSANEKFNQAVRGMSVWFESLRIDLCEDPVSEKDETLHTDLLRLLCETILCQSKDAYQSGSLEEWTVRLPHGHSVLAYPQSEQQVTSATDEMHQKLLELRLHPDPDLLSALE